LRTTDVKYSTVCGWCSNDAQSDELRGGAISQRPHFVMFEADSTYKGAMLKSVGIPPTAVGGLFKSNLQTTTLRI